MHNIYIYVKVAQSYLTLCHPWTICPYNSPDQNMSGNPFSRGSNPGLICLQCTRSGFDPWVGRIPWRREVFWPGESPGQRSLAGYNPWGCKESDMTEQLTRIYIYFLYIYLLYCTHLTR